MTSNLIALGVIVFSQLWVFWLGRRWERRRLEKRLAEKEAWIKEQTQTRAVTLHGGPGNIDGTVVEVAEHLLKRSTGFIVMYIEDPQGRGCDVRYMVVGADAYVAPEGTGL